MSSIGPPTGMRDWLPQDALLRQRLMETISSVYRLYGYLPIDTPAMEDLAVLLGKGGGENEKLLFKVLKRGEKLAQAKDDELADYGLRYDLTVPLARFVATHQGKIPKVFRRYHIGPVWRADRPQKGRFREFYQCDIDVVGGSSSAYEVEVITATERVLKELSLGRYRFRLSDKRLLPLVLQGFGVAKNQVGPILIALDKLDKDVNQARREIDDVLSHHPEPWKKVTALLLRAYAVRQHDTGRHERMAEFKKYWDSIDHPTIRADIANILTNLQTIIASVQSINPESSIVFDPLLVRGMDYYTGPVYEAVVEGFSSSILGGGRYDELIGQFAGKKIPAVGCSIGFERILSLLQEQELKKASPQSSRVLPRVLLIRDGVDTIHLHQQAEKLREGLRSEGIGVEVYLDDDDVGRQFKYAETAGITWAIKRFDAASSSVTVRYLPERTDLTLSMSEFKARLRGNNPV